MNCSVLIVHRKSVAHQQKTNTCVQHAEAEDIVWKEEVKPEEGMLKNPDEMKERNKKG